MLSAANFYPEGGARGSKRKRPNEDSGKQANPAYREEPRKRTLRSSSSSSASAGAFTAPSTVGTDPVGRKPGKIKIKVPDPNAGEKRKGKGKKAPLSAETVHPEGDEWS
ncbi:hypothetical protein FPOA_06385 [Fusarium poae]|uniref:Uncharacterized protein n=1 Tax=Fusarium poae TaxID=36050 RepID=A0A1B8AZD1_FUSPO|nr:hypothetical protein FPOA_06385 [Fusarium poae]